MDDSLTVDELHRGGYFQCTLQSLQPGELLGSIQDVPGETASGTVVDEQVHIPFYKGDCLTRPRECATWSGSFDAYSLHLEDVPVSEFPEHVGLLGRIQMSRPATSHGGYFTDLEHHDLAGHFMFNLNFSHWTPCPREQ